MHARSLGLASTPTCRQAGWQQEGAPCAPPPAAPPSTAPHPPPPPTLTLTRRAAHTALAAALAAWACPPPPPASAGGLDKYVRKRKLDPLASYVPPVLDARAQLARLPAAFGEPKDARRLLRSGAFEGLRDNVRAIGEYAAAAAAAAGGAATAGGAAATPRLATDFFTALEGLDGVLYRAARDGVPTPTADADERLAAALAALDRLLATVPGDVLDAARRVVGVGSESSAVVAGGGGGGSGAGAAPPAVALSEILPSGAAP